MISNRSLADAGRFDREMPYNIVHPNGCTAL